ncbi:MAG TPA: IS110 family transposase, partial [Candidatus Nitrosotalea sp.]|nr:IS110 family transposase [Candidatus Nitrosotalea sp.]
ITFVGLDVHKEAINVAMLQPGETRPVEWQASNDPAAVRRLVRKLQRSAVGELRLCYEAGPCGYAVQRTIRALGVSCVVVAPSLIPRKPGERVKTDRRDARKLAELLRAGLLSEVHPPTEADEAVRDLCRAREDAHGDLVRGRHRVSKLLLRHGWTWTGGKKMWGQGHRLWLRSLRFEHKEDQWVLEDYLLALEHLEERLRALDAQLEQTSLDPRYTSVVAALRCFRGIDTLTAICLVAELHDFMRFDSARGLMAYLGLVPSEHSSGAKQHRGEITKAGNRHARRLLIEASWHYRHHPSTLSLRKRREGQPARVIAIADRAMLRLHRRFNRMLERGKPRPKIVVAVARELTGFIWAAMRNHPA